MIQSPNVTRTVKRVVTGEISYAEAVAIMELDVPWWRKPIIRRRMAVASLALIASSVMADAFRMPMLDHVLTASGVVLLLLASVWPEGS